MKDIEEFSVEWVRQGLPYEHYTLEVFFTYNIDPFTLQGESVILFDNGKDEWWVIDKVQLVRHNNEGKRFWCELDCKNCYRYSDRPTKDDVMKELI